MSVTFLTNEDKAVLDQNISELSEENAKLLAGAHDEEQKLNILVGSFHNASKGANVIELEPRRMTNDIPIPVNENTRITATDLPDYRWAIVVYDNKFTLLNDTGWIPITNYAFEQEGYININLMHKDNIETTQADAEAILNGVKIVTRNAIYVKSVNGITPDADGNIDLNKAKETYAEIVFSNGVTSGVTGEFEYNSPIRVTTREAVEVEKGGKIFFTGIGTYDYSPIMLYSDGSIIGYVDWNNSPEFDINYTGLLKINVKRVDGGEIGADQSIEIAELIKVRQYAVVDAKEKHKMEARTDLMNSITVEFNRTEGASYQLVRIPMTTNDGRKVLPIVRLTSGDGSLNGAKCSTLTYARREKTAFAMNAGLFDVTNAVPLGQTIIDGVSIVNEKHPQGANGETISETECYPLCIDANGWLSAPYPNTVDTATMIADGVKQATTGWIKIVENYEIMEDEIATEIVHPIPYVQNVLGQFDNGDYIVCSVSNKGYGNSAPNDNGLTYTQVAQILVDKGVKFAYALDGGGSAQTVLGMRHINPIYEGTAGRAIPSVIVFEAK